MGWDTTASGLECTACGSQFAVGESCICPPERAEQPVRASTKRKRKRRSKPVTAARKAVPEGQRHLLELEGCAPELIQLNADLKLGIISASEHATLSKNIKAIADMHQSGAVVERVEELEQRLADLDAKLESAKGGASRHDMATPIRRKAGRGTN